jgi:hypothetical protein
MSNHISNHEQPSAKNNGKADNFGKRIKSRIFSSSWAKNLKVCCVCERYTMHSDGRVLSVSPGQTIKVYEKDLS